MHERDQALDIAKTLAAVSIVLLHTASLYADTNGAAAGLRAVSSLASWGLPFFLAAAGYFQGSLSGRREDGTIWAARRARRLIPPYAIWSAMYLGAWLLLTRAQGLPYPRWNPIAVVFLGGADAVLWFLPAILYISLLFVDRPSERRILLMMAAAAVADVVMTISAGRITGNILINRFPLALILYAIGYLLSQRPIPASGTRIRLLGSGIALMTLSAVLSAFAAPTELMHFVAFRLPWAAAALWLPAIARFRVVDALHGLAVPARWGVGVYMIHALVVRLLLLYWPSSRGGWILWLLVAFPSVLLFTEVLSMLLYQWRGSRLLVQ